MAANGSTRALGTLSLHTVSDSLPSLTAGRQSRGVNDKFIRFSCLRIPIEYHVPGPRLLTG